MKLVTKYHADKHNNSPWYFTGLQSFVLSVPGYDYSVFITVYLAPPTEKF